MRNNPAGPVKFDNRPNYGQSVRQLWIKIPISGRIPLIGGSVSRGFLAGFVFSFPMLGTFWLSTYLAQLGLAMPDVAELLMLHEAIDGDVVHETTEFWLRR